MSRSFLSTLVGAVAFLLAGAANAQTPPPASPPAPTAAKPVAIIGSLPVGLRERESFEASLTVTGGTPPYSWSVVAGALPEGVALHSKAGFLHGAPARRGEYRFTVQARDANDATVTREFQLPVFFEPVRTPTSPGDRR